MISFFSCLLCHNVAATHCCQLAVTQHLLSWVWWWHFLQSHGSAFCYITVVYILFCVFLNVDLLAKDSLLC